jgi:hypothetical protein
VIYLAYGTRSIGIALLPVPILVDLYRNRRVTKPTLGMVGVALSLIIAQSFLIPETGNYLELIPKPIPELLATLLFSSVNNFKILASIFEFKNYIIQDVVLVFTLELAVVGVMVRRKAREITFEIFCLIYLGGLMIWPQVQGLRFIFPLIPFYLLFILTGFQTIQTRLRGPSAMAENQPNSRRSGMLCPQEQLKFMPRFTGLADFLPYLLLLLLVLYYAGSYTPLLPRAPSQVDTSGARELFQYVRQNTQTGDVIAFFKPRVLALYTDRPSVAVAIPDPHGNTLRRIHELQVKYVAIWTTHNLEYQPEWIRFIYENPDEFQMIYENSEFRMYRFLDQPLPPDGLESEGVIK